MLVMHRAHRRFGAFCTATLLPVLAASCGTADLYLTNDRAFTGRIVEADWDSVYLDRDVRQVQDGPYTRHVHNLTTVPRNEIKWVDHPGNGIIIAGVLSTALGVVTANWKRCGAFTPDFPCQLSHIPLLVGVPLTLYGSFDWLGSYLAYTPKSKNLVRSRSGR
jgi:hypothetical protein